MKAYLSEQVFEYYRRVQNNYHVSIIRAHPTDLNYVSIKVSLHDWILFESLEFVSFHQINYPIDMKFDDGWWIFNRFLINQLNWWTACKAMWHPLLGQSMYSVCKWHWTGNNQLRDECTKQLMYEIESMWEYEPSGYSVSVHSM